MKKARRVTVAGQQPRDPLLLLSATSIAEDAEVGDAVGTLSVSNLGALTVSSYAITADPDSKFAIDGAALELADTLDYETATSHSVTVEATLSDASTVSRTFTIGVTDVTGTAPVVESFSPLDNATDAEVDGDLVVVFTADVFAGTGNIELYDSDDALVEAFDVETDVDFTADTVTVTPTAPLDPETEYYVLIDAGAIVDGEAAPYGGISDPTTWNFTTAAEEAGEWFTVYEDDVLADNASGWDGWGIRQVFGAALLANGAGTKIRVTLKASSAFAQNFAHFAVGHAASSGDAYDMDGGQQIVTFAASESVSIPSGSSHVTSDEIDFTYDGTKALVVSIETANPSGTAATVSSPGVALYGKIPATAGEFDDSNVDGFSSFGTFVVAVSKIEAFGTPA